MKVGVFGGCLFFFGGFFLGVCVIWYGVLVGFFGCGCVVGCWGFFGLVFLSARHLLPLKLSNSSC